MEYGILWILAMLTSLSFTALAVALLASFKKRLFRYLWILAVIGVLTSIFGIFSLFTGLMYYNNLIIPSWLFPYTTSFSLIYMIAALVILRRGLSVKTGTTPARDWKRRTLAFSIFLGIILTLTTYYLIDLNRQNEFSKVNSDLKTRLKGIWPSEPPSHLNAYPLYQQVSKALDEKEKDRIRDYNKSDRQPSAPEIKEFLNRNKQLIDTLHHASNKPFHYWGSPVGMSLLWLFQFPHFPDYRQMAGLLGLKARAEVLSDNPDGALRERTAIRSMIKHLQSAPQLILWLYSHIVTKQEFDYMEYFLAQTPSVNGLFRFPIKNTPSILQSCKGWMVDEAAIELHLAFLMMQQGEVIEDLIQSYDEMFKSLGAASPIVLPYILHPLPRSLWRVFIGQSYLNNVRDKWEKTNKIAESKYKHWRDFKILKSELEGKRKSLLNIAFKNQSFAADDQFWVLTYIKRFIIHDVYNWLMDVAVAAFAYREVKGLYPETVDDLVPAFLEKIPIDPYDGKPLKIKKVHDGLDLYSVGPVAKDWEGNSGERKPIHFYLGLSPYRKYRVEPAKIKRAQEEEKRKALEKKRKRKSGRKIKPRPKKRKDL